MRRPKWLRGAMTLAVLGALAGAAIMSPVGAAFDPTKGKVKKVARKQANKQFNKKIGPALESEQDACADGAVRGYAYLVGGDLGPAFGSAGILHFFNCTGGTVEARYNGVGDYDVRFNGLTSPAMAANDGAVANVSAGNDDTLSASYEATSGVDFLEILVFDETGAADDDEVSVVLFNDPV